MVNIQVCHEFFSEELLRSNPEKIFVFGDNLARQGRGGQAVIRFEPNAFGIATKRYPSLRDYAFFDDKEEEFAVVEDDLLRLLTIARSPSKPTIVFPAQGIGTGLANMRTRSPLLFKHLNKLLWEYFDFDNTQGQQNQG